MCVGSGQENYLTSAAGRLKEGKRKNRRLPKSALPGDGQIVRPQMETRTTVTVAPQCLKGEEEVPAILSFFFIFSFISFSRSFEISPSAYPRAPSRDVPFYFISRAKHRSTGKFFVRFARPRERLPRLTRPFLRETFVKRHSRSKRF